MKKRHKRATDGLVVAELTDGITDQMRNDNDAMIVSDGAVFLLVTGEHSRLYPELEFLPATCDALCDYDVPDFPLRVG